MHPFRYGLHFRYFVPFPSDVSTDPAFNHANDDDNSDNITTSTNANDSNKG